MTLASARRRYVTDAIQTVSPQQLVVMLYDRLLLDITRAAEALERRDLPAVNNNLTHAQDIVLELENSLNPTMWSGGPVLQELYRFLNNELITANVTKDARRIEICRGLVEPLVEAWRQAAVQMDASQMAPITVSASAAPVGAAE